MKKVLLNSGFVLLLALQSCTKSSTIKVLQLNIWQEGTKAEGGYEAIADEISRSDADFVTLSEVRNYHNTKFCDRIVQSLKERGKTYYSFYSYDSGILSKYPILDSTVIFPENNDHGSIYKAVVKISGKRCVVYTAHLDYLNCALYLPGGYDGSTWEKLAAPITDADSILRNNLASLRDDAIRLFIEDAIKEVENKSLIFLGGDFNEPSHLDWVEANKDLYDHNGMVIDWHVSTLLYEAGFKDAYREKFPNPIDYPGFTYPADCPHVPIEKLAWSPQADDRDRIDFIYYFPYTNLELSDASILGPSGSIAYGKRIRENSSDNFILPNGVWPSDHKAVLVSFLIKN